MTYRVVILARARHDVQEKYDWIAADSPWFPARHAQSQGATRELYDAAIGVLMQAQLIEARDWVKDLGQAFARSGCRQRTEGMPTR